MKRFFEWFIAAMLFLSPAGAIAAPLRVAVFGDSLTSGYRLQPAEAFPARLQQKLHEDGFDAEVLNMSVAGETTGNGAARVAGVVGKKPDVVVVEFGANDVLRGLDPALAARNLDHILDALSQSGCYTILVGMKALPNLGPSYGRQLDDVYANLHQHYHVAFYPFILNGVAMNPELNLDDGMHPNPKGVDIMVSHLYPLVEEGLRARAKAAAQ